MLPQYFLFSSTLILGSLIALSSSHWVMVWFGLELNMFSFIPLIFSSLTTRYTEAAVKYFIAQVMGSSLLLLSSLLSWGPHSEHMYSLILIFAIAFKLGMVPCHFWFPAVMASMSWFMCLILMTWQKMVPLFFLIFQMSPHQPSILFLLASLNSLIGGIGGLNQTQLRPLFAYSSINHMGWMLAASICSIFSSLMYFLIYVLLSSSILLILSLFSQMSPLTFSPMMTLSITSKLLFTILMISLAGIPPFIGFFSKWLVLSSLIEYNLTFISIPLILGSLISLVYYFNIIMSMTLSNSFPSPNFPKPASLLPFMSFFLFMSLGLMPMLMFISALAYVDES